MASTIAPAAGTSKFILSGPENVFNLTSGAPASGKVVFGTAQIDQTFGVVKSATAGHKNNMVDVLDSQNNVLAMIFSQTGWTVSLEVLFDTTGETPRMGKEIAFSLPVASNLNTTLINSTLYAVVTKAEVKWEQGGTRSMSIEAVHNDSLAAVDSFYSRVIKEDGTIATNGSISTRDS